MIAVVAPRLGGPWEVREVPDPLPGPGEVLVRIEASGICHTDSHHLTDPSYGTAFPIVAGHEPVGTVIALGPRVDGLALGDRVGGQITQRYCGACRYCSRGREEMCTAGPGLLGLSVAGSHAELAVLRAAATEKLPPQLDPAEAAPIFCAGYTAYSGLRDTDLRPGERVAIVGIGGLGHLAVQYAAAMGAEVIAVTANAAKRARILSLGAHDVVVMPPGEAEAARRRLGQLDVIAYCGTTVEPGLLDALAPYGRVSLCGVTDTPLVLTPRDAVLRKLTVFGSSHGPRERLREAIALHATAGIRSAVERYPLSDALVAYERVTAGQAEFRAVLVPDD